MLPRLARSAAIAAGVVVAVVAAAVLIDPSLRARVERWSPVYAGAVLGGTWIAALVGVELARVRAAVPRRGRSLRLPPIRCR